MTKLNEVLAGNIRLDLQNGLTEIVIARMYKISRQTVNLIKQNMLYKGYGPDVSYIKKGDRGRKWAQDISHFTEMGYDTNQIQERLGITRAKLMNICYRFGIKPIRSEARSPLSKKNGNQILNFYEAYAIRVLLRRNTPVKEIAKLFGVHINTIYHIKRNDIWKYPEAHPFEE